MRIHLLAAAGVSVLTLLSVACASDHKSEYSDINNFEVREVIKSASKSYRITDQDSVTNYLTVYTSVQWPLRFGDADLGPLCDTILAKMYQVAPGTDVDRAIYDFINDGNIFDDHQISCTPIDQIPEETPAAYSFVYTAKLLELTEKTATYQITNNSYLGGAHPNTSTYPFTYDLVNATVLNLQNVFKPDTQTSLLGLIKEGLASQEGVSVARLSTADIFVDDLFVSPLIYISASGGGVVFHYNPYQIAPYYKGAIDVEIPAYELTPYLTARADSLINQ